MKERTIILAYMSTKTSHRKINFFTYSYPKHEGQITITKRFMKKAPISILNMLTVTAVTKYLTPILIQELNIAIKINQGFNFESGRVNKNLNALGLVFIDRNAGIVQEVSNKLAHYSVKNGFHSSIWEFLLLSCTFTCVADAMNLHHDEPKTHPFKETELRGNKGFVETRTLLKIDFLSNFDKMKPPLGRGGGGHGVFTVALIDHSVSFPKSKIGKYDYTHFQQQHEISLTKKKFLELKR